MAPGRWPRGLALFALAGCGAALPLPAPIRRIAPLGVHADTGLRALAGASDACGLAWTTLSATGAAATKSSLPAPAHACARAGARRLVAMSTAAGARGPGARGEPGAVLAAIDDAGTPAWSVDLGATAWVTVAAVALTPGGDALAVGSFAGTLRVGSQLVASAGASDGFAVAISAEGQPRWLVRVGGPGGDALRALGLDGEHVVVGGSAAGDADVAGRPIAVTPGGRHPDAVIARFAVADGALGWAQAFGGEAPESVAGLAVLGDTVVVASTLRYQARIGAVDVAPRGPGAALVSRWRRGDGAPIDAVTLDAEGGAWPTAVTVAGGDARVAIAFLGHAALGALDLHAESSDAAIVTLRGAEVVDVVAISGEGREEVAALAASADSVTALVTHTSRARVGELELPLPTDGAGTAMVRFGY